MLHAVHHPAALHQGLTSTEARTTCLTSRSSLPLNQGAETYPQKRAAKTNQHNKFMGVDKARQTMNTKEGEKRNTNTHAPQRARRTRTQPEPQAQWASHAKEQNLTKHATTSESQCPMEDSTPEHTNQGEDRTEHGQNKLESTLGDSHGAPTHKKRREEREREKQATESGGLTAERKTRRQQTDRDRDRRHGQPAEQARPTHGRGHKAA